MSLRARIFAGVLLACAVPSALFVWWARGDRHRAVSAVVDGAQQERLAHTIAERNHESIALRRELDSLCDDSLDIDAVTTELAQGRWDARRASDESARLPAVARARGLDWVVLLTADGHVLATSDDFAARQRQFLDDAMRAGDRVSVRPFGQHAEYLVGACRSGEAPATVLVVAARRRATTPLPLGAVGAQLAAAGADADTRDLVAAGIVLFFGLLAAVLLSSDVGRSMRTIQLAAARIGQGATDSSHGGKARGEVARTLAALDAMSSDLAKAQRRLLRAERIAAWRDIARRIAHEIKNPLSPIQTSIETMRKTYAKKHPDFDEIFEESTLTILEEVERLKRIVEEFSRFARMPRPRAEVLDVADVVAHVESLAPANDVPLHVETRGAVPTIRADREQLVQVLVNLIQNGADAARSRAAENAQVTLLLEPWEKTRGVVLTIRDNGPGIPPAERQNVFEPYYTTKSGGTGLGLAIVHRIVVDHRGTVEIDEAQDGSGGAEVRVTLPVEGPGPEVDVSMADASQL